MSMEAMQVVAAKLLTDHEYRASFFDAPPNAFADHGLERAEFLVLRMLDASKLDIVSEGYVGKRWDVIGSVFPRTLDALAHFCPGARQTYLESTSTPANDTEERAAFRTFLDETIDVATDERRYLCDLAHLDGALHDHPLPAGLPEYRFRPESTKPRRAADAITLAVAGPLEHHIGLRTNTSAPRLEASSSPLPWSYSESPRNLLVLREGGSFTLELLDDNQAALLASCDGTQTVAALVQAHGTDADNRLRTWFRHRIVEDAASV